MSAISEVETFVEALRGASEATELWPTLADVIKTFGPTLGLSADVIEAAQESSDVEQFFEKLSADIIGGSVGAAVAVELVSCLADIGAGEAISGPASALELAGSLAGLPEIVTLGAAAVVFFGVDTVVSSNARSLIQEAYDGLAASLNNTPNPGAWTQIGTDSSGDSLLMEAMFDSSISAALGLSADSTMLADIVVAGTGSTNALANGDIAASSLQSDANLLGAVVAANEIGGPAPTDGAVNPLAGTAATQALCDIAVQYAGDQAATASAGPPFLLNPNPYGDFAASSSALNINLNPANWSTTYAQSSPTIIGEQELFDAITTNLFGAGASTSVVDAYLAQEQPSLIELAARSDAAHGCRGRNSRLMPTARRRGRRRSAMRHMNTQRISDSNAPYRHMRLTQRH